MTNTQDQYKNWYKSMWKIYNSEWDKFLREYVFSKDPPFKIKYVIPKEKA